MLELFQLKTGNFLLIVCLIFCQCSFGREYEKILEAGETKTGKAIPSFGASSSISNKLFSQTSPPGRFYVHYISNTMPPACIDLECDKKIKIVIEKGGHFFGFSDGKASVSVGLKLWTKADHYKSIMIVTDHKGIVLGIYKNAKLKHLTEILKEYKGIIY